MKTPKQVLSHLFECAVKNPKTTIAGLSALLIAFFPQHKEQITAVAVALVGLLSGDVKKETKTDAD